MPTKLGAKSWFCKKYWIDCESTECLKKKKQKQNVLYRVRGLSSILLAHF